MSQDTNSKKVAKKATKKVAKAAIENPAEEPKAPEEKEGVRLDQQATGFSIAPDTEQGDKKAPTKKTANKTRWYDKRAREAYEKYEAYRLKSRSGIEPIATKLQDAAALVRRFGTSPRAGAPVDSKVLDAIEMLLGLRLPG